jgi:hypothetical protein
MLIIYEMWVNPNKNICQAWCCVDQASLAKIRYLLVYRWKKDTSYDVSYICKYHDLFSKAWFGSICNVINKGGHFLKMSFKLESA